MAEVKVTKKVDYTVNGVKRTAIHNVILSYETTKVGGATILNMTSLTVTGAYGGSGAGPDGSNGGVVTLALDGSKFVNTSDTFGAASETSTAERIFGEKRAEALRTSDYFGARYVPTQLQYTKKLTVAVSVYNPASRKYEVAASDVAITIPGTGIAPLKGKPKLKVSKLTTPVRASGGSRVMTSTWDYPSSMGADSNSYRADNVRLAWVVTTVSKNGEGKKGTIKAGSKGHALTLKTASLNLGNFTAGNGKTYNRASFYPLTDKTLKSLSLSVIGYNAKGEGPAATVTREFKLPAKPVISAIKQDESTGRVSVTIKADAGHGYAERYDTRYVITFYDTSKPKEKRTVWRTDATFTGTSKTISHDIPNRMALGTSNYIKVTVSAWSRGFAGKTYADKREAYVSWPQKPSIKSIVIPKASKQTELLASKATVNISTAATTEHPVTGIKLEALVNVPYSKANDIPGNAGWAETGAEDNGSCTAMSVTVGDINPEVGNRTWLRLKSWNAIEGIFKTYSEPMQAAALYKKAPTAADDTVEIVSVESGEDGRSAVATIVWKADDSTGTEVSWSDNENGWRSTEEPQRFSFTESDGPRVVGSKTWANSYTLHIRGLEEDVTYYVKARRYHEGDTTTYGQYYPDNTGMQVTPVSTPDSCTINVPEFVKRGSSVEITWGHSGESPQKAWELVTGKATTTTDADGVKHSNLTGKLTSVAHGSGSMASYVISASRLKSLVGTGAGIYLAVKVSTTKLKTSYVMSEARMVRIADAPEVEVRASTLTVQPLTMMLGCNLVSDVSIVVRSQGADGQWPEGPRTQLADDVIWSGLVTPDWQAENANRVNLLTNRPEAWENSNIYREDVDSPWLETETPYVLSLRKEQAIPVTAGAYTLSMDDGSAYEASITAYADGEVTDEGLDWTDQLPATITVTDADSVIIRLRHTDESEAVPDELGFEAKVQLESGSSATAWGLPDSDVKGLSATFTLPEGLDFWDGAAYTITATAAARDTGLVSEEATDDFTVDWARDAPEPSDLTTIDVSDEMDSEGRRVRSALITLIAPDGAAEGDLCDIYRVTPDGPSLLIDSVPTDAIVYDQWAPFGGSDLAYRIAIRTADGAVSWADIGYDFDSADVFTREVRVDYGDGYFELDRNVDYSESHEKGFEARKHLDGTTVGYWEAGTMRTASASGVLVAVYEADKIERLRELAAYTGPVFVRTSEGVAYEADVQVRSIDSTRGTAAVAVSLEISEVRPTTYGGVVQEAEE